MCGPASWQSGGAGLRESWCCALQEISEIILRPFIMCKGFKVLLSVVTNHECSDDVTQSQPADSAPALVGSTRSELRISLTLPLLSARCIHLGVHLHIPRVTFPTYFPRD